VRKVRNRIESVRVKGKTYRGGKQILEQAVRFWEEMYRKDGSVLEGGMERKMSRKVGEEGKRSLEKKIEFGEFVEAVKKMKKRKTPEWNGLGIEVYKTIRYAL
jgi:hypothetical protein